jgi:arginine repressor
MSTTTVSRDLTLDDIQHALSDALGPAYKVTATSDSTLKVRRFPLMTAMVNVKWDEAHTTTLHAAPGEAWIFQGINALTIYPKVRRALSQAFTTAS